MALVTPVNDISLNILLHPKLDELELVEPSTFRKLLLIQQSSVFGRVIWGEHASVYFYPLGYYGASVYNNDIEKAINLAFNDWKEIHNK